MTKYERTRRAIIDSAGFVGALAQAIMWFALILNYWRGEWPQFWASAAVLLLLKLGDISDNLERRS